MDDRVAVLVNLERHFHQKLREDEYVHAAREFRAGSAGATTIGVEVEVRYSSYFPSIYEHFGLAHRSYSSLSPKEQKDMTNETEKYEGNLMIHLFKVAELGVPKGKDRYWEFAHRPVSHPYTLAEEVIMLQRLDLIPTNQKHSLHITLGGLPMGKEAGMLLMVLELLGYTSKARLMSGVNADKAISWGRRGRAGMRLRTEDLEMGASTAVEFRTLELPADEQTVRELLYVTWFLAETIRRPDMRASWNMVLAEAIELMDRAQLDVSENWGRGYENVDKWTQLADTIESIDNSSLWTVVKRVINYQDKLLPHNVYLRDGIAW